MTHQMRKKMMKITFQNVSVNLTSVLPNEEIYDHTNSIVNEVTGPLLVPHEKPGNNCTFAIPIKGE